MTDGVVRLRRTAQLQAALNRGHPVVALESSVFAQGLMPPHNRVAAQQMTDAIVSRGALPIVSAVVEGVPTLGLEAHELERFLNREGVRKVSSRDLPWTMTTRGDGATTVAATLVLCALGGLGVFATGGIGGVHRDAPYDESADLLELSRNQVLVVCAGAKSILDLPATVERLESLSIPVIGYRTRHLPGFFTAETDVALDATADSVRDIAMAWHHHRALGRPGAMVIVQAPPLPHALGRRLVDEATDAALLRARESGVKGGAVTPFLLAEIDKRTDGASVRANLALLEANAALAAEIAVFGELNFE